VTTVLIAKRWVSLPAYLQRTPRNRHIEENYATQGTEQECVRCGAHRSTFPGDPGFRPRIPPGYEGGAPSQ
jgi:hypothetical protein